MVVSADLLAAAVVLEGIFRMSGTTEFAGNRTAASFDSWGSADDAHWKIS